MTAINEIMEQALVGVRPPPKPTLASLMSALEQMESVLDNVGEITRDMVAEHFEAVGAVDEKTDRLIGFMESMQKESAAASLKAEAWKAKAKSYESALERCKEYAKWLLTTYPNLEYRGNRGRLALQRVAPKLVITTPQHRFSSERVIPDDQVLSIPENLRKVNVVWLYDTDAIREALKSGEETPIARLDENYSVRIKL